MMKTKSRMAAALASVFLCLPVFALPAYAQSTEPTEEPPAQEETTTAKPPSPRREPAQWLTTPPTRTEKSFIPFRPRTSTVFFLVIDKQRTSENVYFLDAVTEKRDLLSSRKVRRSPRRWSRNRAHTCAAGARRRAGTHPAPEPERKTVPLGQSFWCWPWRQSAAGPAGT